VEDFKVVELPRRKKTALALPGCGARGIVQAGMIKALVDRNIRYDATYATSFGALNAAFLHQYDWHGMYAMWRKIRQRHVASLAPWNLFSSAACLFDPGPLVDLIHEWVFPSQVRGNYRRLVVNTVDARTSELLELKVHTLSSEDMKRVLLAAAAPPMIFPPIPYKGRRLFDGGMYNHFSVDAARRDGYERIIVLNPNFMEPRPLKNLCDAYEFGANTFMQDQLNRAIGEAKALGVEMIVVQPKRPTKVGIFDFNHKENRDSLLQYGYSLALDTFKQLEITR
jgi:predicted acylesterase/phospholipase RssA